MSKVDRAIESGLALSVSKQCPPLLWDRLYLRVLRHAIVIVTLNQWGTNGLCIRVRLESGAIKTSASRQESPRVLSLHFICLHAFSNTSHRQLVLGWAK
eukprot:scaffold76914_cov24-Prasinocladus_malaysianus.AAC.1